MWYSTDFSGKVEIIPEPTASVLLELKELIDSNEAHRETSWALEIGNDYKSIVWRWAEKTYDFESCLNAVEKKMKEKYPEFELVWEFEFQWEDSDDRWFIRKLNWSFERVMKVLEADEYKCPDCWHIFKPEPR